VRRPASASRPTGVRRCPGRCHVGGNGFRTPREHRAGCAGRWRPASDRPPRRKRHADQDPHGPSCVSGQDIGPTSAVARCLPPWSPSIPGSSRPGGRPGGWWRAATGCDGCWAVAAWERSGSPPTRHCTVPSPSSSRSSEAQRRAARARLRREARLAARVDHTGTVENVRRVPAIERQTVARPLEEAGAGPADWGRTYRARLVMSIGSRPEPDSIGGLADDRDSSALLGRVARP
jgi:hypothetical protein